MSKARRKTGRTLAALTLAALLAVTAGCVPAITGTTLKPRLSPPAIGSAGVLRAAIDLAYPPFGGTVKDRKVGLDVDIASAVAEQLGLKLEIVNAKPEAGAELVRTGKADIVMGALTVEQSVSLQLAYAGTYATDSSAVFAADVTTLTIGDLSGRRVAAQTGSLAYWYMLDQYGEEGVILFPTLLEAMKAVGAGKADTVVGDAIMMSYVGRTVTGLRYGGQLDKAYPLGIGVAQDKSALEAEIRTALDKLSSQGVLETLRRKWAGDLPRFTVPGEISGAATSAVEPTAAP